MTSTDWIALLVVFLSIVITGFLAASEVAITRMNRVRAVRLVEEHRRGAVQLSRIVDSPAPYLNVVLFLTLLFTIGGSTTATSFAGGAFCHTRGGGGARARWR